MTKKDIKSMDFAELAGELKGLGLPSYRAGQIYGWLHQSGAESFDEMTNLSKVLREELRSLYEIKTCSIVECFKSQLDETRKYLFELTDGEYIESVLMRYKYGDTLCISTQVGCKMGCTFCASTIGGFKRHLTASEMLSQIHSAQKDSGTRISHVVLMGMGEPLDNFENVMRFLKLVSDDKGLNISMRHISLSTSGVVPRIYDLAEYNFQLTLSVSLHAPNDEIRTRIMPVNRKWQVDELLKACREYIKCTGRRISFEYAMIHGVNDTQACAQELAQRLKGMLCHINLIPANEVRENDYVRSTRDDVEKFKKYLERCGMNVTIRRSLGSDINASCGQLRQKKLEGGGVLNENYR